MNKHYKNFNYFWVAKAINQELSKAIDEKKPYFELKGALIAVLANLAEAWNIRPKNGWSGARTLWYRILEGSK